MATTQIKKHKKNNFYHLVLSSIKTTDQLPQNLTSQRAYYYTKPLKDSGLIRYKSSGKKGYWYLTELFKRLDAKGLIKKTTLHTLVKPNTSVRVNNKNIRGHGFGFRLKLPKIAHWGNRYSITKSYGLNPTKLTNGNPKILLSGNKTHLNERSIVMYFDSDYSFLSDSAEDSFRSALNYFLRKMQSLEDKFKISFKIRGRYKLRCFKHHFGHLNNVLGRRCKIDGKSYYIRRENGSLWLIIDFSHNDAEVETVDKDTAVVDMDAKIKPLFDEVDRNPHFMTDTRKQIKELAEMVSDLAKTNKRLVEYIQKEKGLNTSDFLY